MLDSHAYKVGERLVLVSHQGREYPAEVIGHNSLHCDLIVRWTGNTPSLNRVNTVCLSQLREVRVLNGADNSPDIRN